MDIWEWLEQFGGMLGSAGATPGSSPLLNLEGRVESLFPQSMQPVVADTIEGLIFSGDGGSILPPDVSFDDAFRAIGGPSAQYSDQLAQLRAAASQEGSITNQRIRIVDVPQTEMLGGLLDRSFSHVKTSKASGQESGSGRGRRRRRSSGHSRRGQGQETSQAPPQARGGLGAKKCCGCCAEGKPCAGESHSHSHPG